MIRKHTEQDLEQLIDIWFRASKVAHTFLPSGFVEKLKNDMREIYIPGSETWVFEEKGNILGFISMMDNEIGGLFVLPKEHKKGIGTKLVKHVIKDHTELEVDVFKMNRIGRAFYDKYGFSQIGESIHKDSGNPVVRMGYKSRKKRK